MRVPHHIVEYDSANGHSGQYWQRSAARLEKAYLNVLVRDTARNHPKDAFPVN